MAVQEQTPLREYTANGVTTSFALGFDCEETNHLIVTLDGVEPPVSSWSLTGGAVVFAVAPISGVLVTIQRDTPLERTIDYQSYNNSLRPESFNKDYDNLWYALQDFRVKNSLTEAKLQELIDQLIAGNINGLSSEILARIAGDESLTNLINQEKQRAIWSELELRDDLDEQGQSLLNEFQRATGAEAGLQSQINALGGGTYGYTSYDLMLADAANISTHSTIRVGGDPDSSKDGDYIYDGTNFTKSPYDTLTQAKSYADNKESHATKQNLFTYDEIVGSDISRVRPDNSRLQVSKVASGIKLKNTQSSKEYRWRFSASLFKSGVISASAKVLSMNAAGSAVTNGGVFYIWQTSSTGATLTSNNVVFNNADELNIAKTVSLQNIALNLSAEFVEVGFLIAGSNSDRELIFTDFFINDSTSSEFVRPSIDTVNQFPDPKFEFLSAAAVYETTSIVKEGDDVVQVLENSSSARYTEYKVFTTGAFSPLNILTFKIDAFSDNSGSTGASASVIFYDESGSEIKRSTQSNAIVNEWDRIFIEMQVPANAAYFIIRINKSGQATVGKFKRPTLSSWSAIKVADVALKTVFYVDNATGSDANPGTQQLPFKTIQRALDSSAAETEIFVAEGDYVEAPQVRVRNKKIAIRAIRHAKVRLIGGGELSNFTKTNGFTKVWQTTASNPETVGTTRSGFWLYQDGVPDENTVIPPNERSKYHLGRSHRLPDFSLIWKVDSVAAIEAATRPSWFWLDGTLYLSCVGGGDPNLEKIYAPTQQSPFYTNNLTKDQVIILEGIQSFYSGHGFRTWDFSHVEFIRCRAMGNRTNGFEFSDSNYVKRVACEAGGNWVDGAGGHVYRANPNKLSCSYEGFGNYDHDNGDDGQSLHEMWSGEDFGGLVEYNYDRGIATAVGAHTRHTGTVCRKNGQGQGLWTIDDGSGFGCVGTSVDGGISTDMELIDCVSEGNLTNFSVTEGNTLTAIDSKSLDPANNHYSSAGYMKLVDCGYDGTGVVKNVTGSGTIQVTNTAPIPD